MTGPWLTSSRRFFLPGLLLYALCMAGCIQRVTYQPDPTLLRDLSREEAAKEIHRVLLRAISPQVDEVKVTTDFLSYRLYPSPLVWRLYFGKIQRVEVYENHAVLVRAYGHVVIGKLVFANLDDATLFADLLISFRDTYLAQAKYPLPRSRAQ
jgi:hypothetical protein